MSQRDQDIRPGLIPNIDGKTSSASVWAPFAHSVAIENTEEISIPLNKAGYGYWEKSDVPVRANELYQIILDDTRKLPDPASLSQPHGVHGSSQIIDLNACQWTDHKWKGIPRYELIIYELHTSTFSKSGDFNGIYERLNYLLELGINTIELMPVARFPGERNWGYDGVFPFSVQNSYGGAAQLQKLVNACHARGIAVMLNVVYNHLGPEGNYLNEFGPYFTDKYKTPWGQAINFDDAWCDGVRHFFIENALMWLRDFHIDGLRLDAVHAIKDLGAHHFLLQLKQAVENQSNTSGRQHHLIAECDLNDVRYLNPPGKGGYNMDSQWCDEFHHALHTLVTDETKGYYSDFGGIGPLIKSFNGAYVYDGIYSPHRHKNFGSKTTGQPGHKFVVFAQNHDQVGNRMLGRRLSSLIGFEMQKISAALFILSPYLPLIFMGEEYGERNPFLYFTSHSDPELIKGVQKGREKEFKDFMKDRKPPNPQSETTWSNSKLTPPAKWSEAQKQILSWYKELILFRKENTLWQGDTRQHFKAKALTDKVMLVTGKRDNQTTRLLYNFGKEPFIYQHQTVKKIFLFSGLSQWGGSINNPNEIKGKNGLLVPPETMVVCSY